MAYQTHRIILPYSKHETLSLWPPVLLLRKLKAVIDTEGSSPMWKGKAEDPS